MPVNDFEKQVSQRMGELKFQPSEEVWNRVEIRIRRAKKKRRWFLWLPLLGLLTAGGGYFIYKESGLWEKQEGKVAQVKNPSPGEEASSIVEPEELNNKIEKRQPKKTDASADVTRDEAKDINHQINPDTQKSIRSLSFQHSVHKEPQKKANDEKHLWITKKKTKDGERAESDDINELTLQKEKGDQNENREENGINGNKEVSPEDNKTVADSSITKPEVPAVNTESKNKITNKDSAAGLMTAAKAIQPFSKKWKFSLAGKIGSFNNVEGLFKFLSVEKSADANYSSGSNSGGGGSVAVPPPSDTRPGLAWSFGLQAAKPLSERLIFVTGLQYAYYTNSRNVGNRRDSVYVLRNNLSDLSVSYAYQNGQTQSYSNHYHFLEVPVLLQWKFSKHVKVPVAIEGGFSIAQVISSDAVFYDPVTGIYYQDKSLIDKTQVHLNIGLIAGLFERTRHPLQIGPVLQYGITSMNKTYKNTNQRLSFAGVKAVWFLRKN